MKPGSTAWHVKRDAIRKQTAAAMSEHTGAVREAALAALGAVIARRPRKTDPTVIARSAWAIGERLQAEADARDRLYAQDIAAGKHDPPAFRDEAIEPPPDPPAAHDRKETEIAES